MLTLVIIATAQLGRVKRFLIKNRVNREKLFEDFMLYDNMPL